MGKLFQHFFDFVCHLALIQYGIKGARHLTAAGDEDKLRYLMDAIVMEHLFLCAVYGQGISLLVDIGPAICCIRSDGDGHEIDILAVLDTGLFQDGQLAQAVAAPGCPEKEADRLLVIQSLQAYVPSIGSLQDLSISVSRSLTSSASLTTSEL